MGFSLRKVQDLQLQEPRDTTPSALPTMFASNESLQGEETEHDNFFSTCGALVSVSASLLSSITPFWHEREEENNCLMEVWPLSSSCIRFVEDDKAFGLTPFISLLRLFLLPCLM
uniref:Uncharacterized protein n=1 Tax=Corethron hystrix TaxID=216773 RepID=A0A7S1BDC8_9STRA